MVAGIKQTLYPVITPGIHPDEKFILSPRLPTASACPSSQGDIQEPVFLVNRVCALPKPEVSETELIWKLVTRGFQERNFEN